MQDIALQNNGRYEAYNQLTDFFLITFLFLKMQTVILVKFGEMSCTIY